MRLFSALAVPADIAGTLARLCGGLPDVRWVDPADFHVTLAFFADIDGDVADDLMEELAQIDAPELDLRITQIGTFGTSAPHAIVAHVERCQALLALEARHRAIMQQMRIGDVSRKYAPHVTLARLRRVPAAAVADWMSLLPALPSLAWHVDRFALYSSATSRGGGPYVAEAEFMLGESTDQ